MLFSLDRSIVDKLENRRLDRKDGKRKWAKEEKDMLRGDSTHSSTKR